MQHGYVGDIGDFGKYALLNYLMHTSAMSLGVVWYLVDPTHTDRAHQAGAGKHINYLGLQELHRDGKKLEECSPDLFRKLKKIVGDNERTILRVQKDEALDGSVTYFNVYLSQPRSTHISERLSCRKKWLTKALSLIRHNEIVFLDPDNGLASDGRNGGKPEDAKYVLHTELKAFWGNGKRIVVLYHHPNRKDKDVDHDTQITRLAKDLEANLEGSSVLPLRYRLGTSRAYFVIVPKDKTAELKNRLLEFANKPWPERKLKGKSVKAFECKFSQVEQADPCST